MRSGVLVFVVASLAIFAMVSAEIIPNQYIVQLKPSLGMTELKLHLASISSSPLYNAELDSITAQWAFEGLNFTAYSAYLSSQELVDYVKSRPEVITIENDQMMHLDQEEACATTSVLNNGLWGLSRISYIARRAAGNYQYYYNNAGDGQGVDVYVVDTGILTTHTDFGGRARVGYNAFSNESPQDLNGHGTHCAGTIAGTNMGIAKRANLISVKVLNAAGSGSATGLINGINWVINNLHATRPCVINMSLGFNGIETSVDNAVNSLVAAGCFTSVAAGNSNTNACNTSPARAASAFTVMATTNTDVRSSFSNFGTCCDIFAPGSNILSDWIGSNSATNTISGTSMAAPHVAGVASSRLSLNPGNTPKQVGDWMKSHGQSNVVQSPGTGSPNYLLYQGCLA